MEDQESYNKGVRDALLLIQFHENWHDGRYCDTGADEEWACRSHCTQQAIPKIMKLIKDL